MTYKKMLKNASDNNILKRYHNSYEYNEHNNVNSHDNEKILTDTDKNNVKNAFHEKNKYECKNCNFLTYNKYNYSTHLTTQKHIKNESKINYQITLNDYICKCSKSYKHRQSLYNHQKKCKINNETNENINQSTINDELVEKKEDDINYKECFYLFMNQLKALGEKHEQLQNTIIDLMPKKINEELCEYKNNNQITQNITNNQNINHHITNNQQVNHNVTNQTINVNQNVNQNFNISIFLNENCKDAMNIGDFVKNIEISVKDLLLSKEKGIVDGLSNIIINHLKEIPLVQRPLWCSDKKKKKLFVKDDCWKEDINNEKTNETIYNVSKIQTKNINKYIEDKPNWMQSDKIKENYINIVKNTTDPIDNKKNKIIDKLIDTIYFTEEKASEIKNNL